VCNNAVTQCEESITDGKIYSGEGATNLITSAERIRKALMGAALTGALTCGVVAAATPAEAASFGWVYISFPKWLGNCAANNGAVKTVWGQTTPGGTVWNADAGDDIVYGRVALGQTNSVQFTLFCAKGVASNYQPGASVSFVPTRNNQTIWVGPTGQWRRN
jgi:hypothetical protein